MFIKYLFPHIAVLMVTMSSMAQFKTLEGKVLDSVGAPLEYANVLAIPDTEDQNIAFSISDDKGNYKLSLQEKVTYNIEISYLGFQKLTDSTSLTEDTIKDFILTPSNESLETVLLKQRLAVQVREDTITYRTDVFVTGEERKLREVLKKLPGVEVDRAGNVTVNGEKVDKLLVEGKPFFTGDTKLGVNNIPADAVDEIDVLSNYNEIAFLKGLTDSDITAMNIKLKEGKRRFVFGDLEAGGGIEERYLINPRLFYYSPKTNANFIGDLNNTGKRSFTFSDYLNFEGGFAKLIDDPIGYFNLSNSEFGRSLMNQDFVFNKNQFGAFNITHRFSPKTDVSAYSIVNGSTTETSVEDVNSYLADNEISLIEKRTTDRDLENIFSLSKITLKYFPNSEADLTYETSIKGSNGTANERLQSLSSLDSNFVNSKNEPKSLELRQHLGYSQQFSFKHTTTINANFMYAKNQFDKNWSFSQPIFSEIVPIQGQAPFNLLQNVKSENYDGGINLKHYWILSDFHHIYPLLGHNYSHQEYRTVDQQRNGSTIINFNDAGFNNSTAFKLHDSYIGMQYKTQVGDLTIKPGLVYHYYSWNISQFSERQKDMIKSQFLPEALIKWDIKNSEKLSLKYNMRSRFNDASYFANNLRLENFNSLYRGNVDLENSLTHNISMRYHKFNLLKGLFYNGSINYLRRIRTVRNKTVLEGIDQINTSIYTNLPETNLSLNGSFSKKLLKIKFTLSGTASLSEYQRNINDQTINYTSNTYSYSFKTETIFKEFPNFEMGLTQGFNNFSSSDFNNNFVQTNPYVILEYDFLKGFILKASYNYNLYRNRRQNEENVFELANTSLYYNAEDSPWGFEISGDNIFDVRFKNQNSFTEFIINDNRIFIQPRTLLFKISYKL